MLQGPNYEELLRIAPLPQVLHILGHLATIWRPVLSRAVFHDMMTSLAEACVARVASEVLQLDDIAVEETTQVRHRCLMLVRL